MLADDRLRAEVLAWHEEADRLLWTSARLVEYFGSEAEEVNFAMAVASPNYWKKQVLAGLEGKDEQAPPRDGRRKFECSEAIAQMLTPILILLSEPVPAFVATARRNLPSAESRHLILPFANFSGGLAENICRPVWRSYPQLAPVGWPL